MNIIVPGVAKRLRITQGMTEDFLYDPVLAAWVFWRIRLDAFQAVRLKMFWFTPFVEDSSGWSSAKTAVAFFYVNLRAVLIPDNWAMVVYPAFQQGKENFWEYYNRFGTALWQAQLGKVDKEGDDIGKDNSRQPACWKQYFKNGSMVLMPAPNLVNESRTLAGLRTNTLHLEEANKIMATEGGDKAVKNQLLGRNTRACFNQHHPIWCNHISRTSTAELADHPAYALHKKMEGEVKRGNPDYATISFCYKDYSNLKCHTGKSFREEFRQVKAIKEMKLANTEERFAAEGLGLWQKQSLGWYTAEMIENCRALGRSRRLAPILGRHQCLYAAAGREVYFFAGMDPAPAQGKRSDDGSFVVLRAVKREQASGEYEGDWLRDFVYAEVLRNKDADDWAGMVHERQRDFGMSALCIDIGGGGQWIGPLLHRTRQKIRGVWETVTPILPRHNSEYEGLPLYFLLSRGEVDLKGEGALWEEELRHARGDDILKDLANTLLRTAIEKGEIGLPPPFQEWRGKGAGSMEQGSGSREQGAWSMEQGSEEYPSRAGWPEARVWALKCLSALGVQLLRVRVLTNEDDTWKVTRNNAKQFYADGKDDLHDAARNAEIAFRVWLRTYVAGMAEGQRTGVALCGWRR